MSGVIETDKERFCYHTKFTRVDYNAGLQDETRELVTNTHCPDFHSTDYTDLDRMIDESEKTTEKQAQGDSYAKPTPEDYEPVHNYKWAMAKALEGEHCVCNESVEYRLRLVYAEDLFTLRRYSPSGCTTFTMIPTLKFIESETWRLWNND